ncbi:MAG: type II secretion system protein [Vicinamibacterales bacterium]
MNTRKADGFALIDILFVLALIGVLSTIALPRMLMARQSAGAASAIGTMRVIHSSQLTFALTCGAGFYAPNLTTLGQAPVGSREAFISPNLSTANTVTKSGYIIEMEGTPFPGAPSSCNGLAVGEAAQGWRAYADPTNAENKRYFGTNVNGTIWEHNASLSAAIPEVGESPAGHYLR